MQPNIYDNILYSLANNNLWEGFLAWFLQFSQMDPAQIGWYFFWHGGWVLFVLMFMWRSYKDIFLENQSGRFQSKWKWRFLAIDIPKNNEQTPKAVENIFAALAGVFTSSNLVDKYWNGKVTESFSFELVSIEGHTRFFIRTPAHFLDFIQAALYSQYPDAEITEVDDYTNYDSEDVDPKTGQPIPFSKLHFPNKLYNMWGAEFVLTRKYPFPIKTYEEFEHRLSQAFLDPMSNLLENMSRLGPGEQTWIQVIVQPQGAPYWKSETVKKVLTELKKEVYKAPESFNPADIINKPLGGALDWGMGLVGHAIGLELGAVADKKKEEDQWKMFKMSPGERTVLEMVEKKLSKHQFKVKYRMIYLAKKEVFAKGRGVTGITGAINQFNTTNANGFKPGSYTKTAADYFFVNHRIAEKQNRILRWFSKRHAWYGESNVNEKITYLNPEELATIWHFPVMTVKATEVGMIQSKKAAPPTRLPYEQRVGPAKREDRSVYSRPIAPAAPVSPDQMFAPPPVMPAYQSPIEEPSYEPATGVPPLAPPLPDMAMPSSLPAEPAYRPPSQYPPSQPAYAPPDNSGPGTVPSRKGAPPPNLPFA
ncbi:MAG: hypothetical protein WC668_04040 [Patescibacteria group bacterium]|jgi:hypothetical protein